MIFVFPLIAGFAFGWLAKGVTDSKKVGS